MSLPFITTCAECLIRSNLETVRKLGGEEKAKEFLHRFFQAMLDAPDYATAPYINTVASELIQQVCHLEGDRYAREKEDANRFVLERMDTIRQKILSAPDPVYAGIQFAILGNYLDFVALKDVSFEKLEEMLSGAANIQVDREVYESLCRELAAGKTMLYVTDNAGEIGFDRLLAEQIAAKYPNITVTFCVRGQITANDATREDAEAVGIDFPIIDNGNHICGTQLELCSEECRKALETSDVVFSKGMANVETLLGCGHNIYFAFLIKCPRFEAQFGKPMYTPMLVKERK